MPRSNGEATAAAGGGAVEAGAVEDIVAADDGAMPTEETSGPAAALSASSSLKQRDDPHLKTAHDLACSPFSDGGDADDKVDDDPDALAVVRFLRSTPGLSRAVVGDLLGDAAPRVSASVLGAFARSFDWHGAAFEEALRRFLDSFRLPGEAQKIYRVLDAWSVAFFEANCCDRKEGEEEKEGKEEEATAAAKTTAGDGDGDGERKVEATPAPSAPRSFPFASADAVHVLAFSAIMLNTDAHNARVRAKMTRAQFVLNNRGINGGGDLPERMLERLYDSIVERPIRGPRGVGEEEAESCSGEGGGGRGGDCSSSGGGGRYGLVPGGGSGSFGGGGGPLARVASAGWSGRGAARGANGSSSGRNGAASGRGAASASGDGSGGARSGGAGKPLQLEQGRRRGLFACFSSSTTREQQKL